MFIRVYRLHVSNLYFLLSVHLNFIISLFQASTYFEYMFSSSGGQKLYYTASGIITPIGGSPVHRLREDSICANYRLLPQTF